MNVGLRRDMLRGRGEVDHGGRRGNRGWIMNEGALMNEGKWAEY